jgi:putative glutamine amidotransferase
MKIGLTSPGSDEKYQLYADWLRGSSRHGVIRLSYKDRNRVEDCDALVLSGGVDVHPEFYGSNITDYPNADAFDTQRDRFEIDSLRKAYDLNLPVLGICRGLQLINVAMGGTLVQDLGTRNDIHQGSPDKKHEVHVEDETMLWEWIGSKEGDVNSAHHQAIQLLGNNLRINCYSVDGMIEGIEGTEPGKLLMAVQWHPERMFKFRLENTPLSKGIRDKFIELAEKS